MRCPTCNYMFGAAGLMLFDPTYIECPGCQAELRIKGVRRVFAWVGTLVLVAFAIALWHAEQMGWVNGGLEALLYALGLLLLYFLLAFFVMNGAALEDTAAVQSNPPVQRDAASGRAADRQR